MTLYRFEVFEILMMTLILVWIKCFNECRVHINASRPAHKPTLVVQQCLQGLQSVVNILINQ